jgi:hypothetical protein
MIFSITIFGLLVYDEKDADSRASSHGEKSRASADPGRLNRKARGGGNPAQANLQHLGRELLHAAVTRSYARHRAAQVWLDVKAQNSRARALYVLYRLAGLL